MWVTASIAGPPCTGLTLLIFLSSHSKKVARELDITALLKRELRFEILLKSSESA